MMMFNKEQKYMVFVCAKSNDEYETHIVNGYIDFTACCIDRGFLIFSGKKISSFENKIYSWSYDAIIIVVLERTKNDFTLIGLIGTLHWDYAIPDDFDDNDIRFTLYRCNRIF